MAAAAADRGGLGDHCLGLGFGIAAAATRSRHSHDSWLRLSQLAALLPAHRRLRQAVFGKQGLHVRHMGSNGAAQQARALSNDRLC